MVIPDRLRGLGRQSGLPTVLPGTVQHHVPHMLMGPDRVVQLHTGLPEGEGTPIWDREEAI